MTRNPKGVLGQIEGLKESFEAVLRKRTQYRQQINQLTACLRERNREIKDLVRRVNELQERDANAELIIQELQERVTARGDLIANQEVEINDLYCSVNEWREKARALAAELHERGGNGETVEDPPEEPLELSQEQPVRVLRVAHPA